MSRSGSQPKGERAEESFHLLSWQPLGHHGLCDLGSMPGGGPGQTSSVASQPLAFLQRVQEKEMRELGGAPTSPYTGHQNFVVHVWVEKEFPDTQYLRRE